MDNFILSWEQMLSSSNSPMNATSIHFSSDCTHMYIYPWEVCSSPEVMCGLVFTWFIIFLELLGEGFDGRPLLARVAVMMSALHLWMTCLRDDLVAFPRLIGYHHILMSSDVSFPLGIVHLCALHLCTTQLTFTIYTVWYTAYIVCYNM